MFKLFFILIGFSSIVMGNSLADYIKNLKDMVLVKESMIPGKDVILPKETPLFIQQTVSMYSWINKGKGTKLNIYIPKEKVELYKTHGPYPDGLTAIAIYEDQDIIFVTEHFEGEPMYGTFDREGNDISQSHPSLNVATCYTCHEGYADICINGTCSVPGIDILQNKFWSYMFISIKSKIFISHFILMVLLLGTLSYKHYYNALDSYIKNVITFHTNSSASIIRTSSLAISGLNYGNIQQPSFVDEVSSNTKLLYLKIVGKSDMSSKDFNAIYDKNTAKIYRSLYPKGYEQTLKEKLTRFKSRRNDSTVDKIKINFLINRVNDSLHSYREYIHFQKTNTLAYDLSFNKEAPYLDFQTHTLFLSLATNNKNAGCVFMVFDISEILEMKHKIIKDLFIETFVTLCIVSMVLTILSNKIIGPLNQLSQYMSKDFTHLNTKDIPVFTRKDEIGLLSNKFKILLENMQEQQKITEKKAYTDGLTGIHNRSKFDEALKEEFSRVQRYNYPLSIAIIDVDKFKLFNDTFGHVIGDEVLIMLADNVQGYTRKSDIFARWGGEEFILLFPETNIDNAKIICNNLRRNIEKMKHPLAGSITVSVGVTQYKENDTHESLFKRCDNALYQAKENGRNKVYVS